MRAMLLAAGKGERLRPLTRHQAKPSVPFLNLPLAFYMLYYLEQLKLEALVINTHYQAQSIKQIMSRRCPTKPYQLIFSHEQEKPLGSAGGLWQARRSLFPIEARSSQPIVVANADSVILFSHPQGLQPFIKAHTQSGAWLSFLTTHIKQNTEQQVSALWTQGSQLKDVGPTCLHQGLQAEHFTGVYIMSPQVMPFLKTSRHIFLDLVKPVLGLQNASPQTAFLSKQASLKQKGLRWPDHALQTYYDEKLRWFNTNTQQQFNSSSLECQQLPPPYKQHLGHLQDYF